MFSANSGGELRAVKIRGIATSHFHVLYIVEFSFRFNNSQQKSICEFGAYIQIILTKFFGGHCLRQGIFQTFCKFLLNPFSYALFE